MGLPPCQPPVYLLPSAKVMEPWPLAVSYFHEPEYVSPSALETLC